MYENTDQLIDINLDKIAKTDEQRMFYTALINIDGKELSHDPNRMELFAKKMQIEGLIIIEPVSGFRCDLTKFGQEIVNKGGWLEHLKRQEAKKNQDAIDNDRRKKTEINNHTISERQVKTSWWSFGFSALAILISLISFIDNRNKDESVTKKQFESELSKIRKSIKEMQTKEIKAKN